ncbi:DUF6934 family protein [Puia sp.]|uniref:DUF6934 family protein n=1 Tax=Puia sp. TaxID=2045100 RepID=UPI0039C8CB9F
MEWERYSIEEDADSRTYEFCSDGPNGRIRKAVRFQHRPGLGRNVYNLLFGDYDPGTGHIDDRVISNNGDAMAILRTVAEAVENFVNLNPQAIILILASSASRMRLYQMSIASALPEISAKYEVLGIKNGEDEPFKKGVNYEAFLVIKRFA